MIGGHSVPPSSQNRFWNTPVIKGLIPWNFQYYPDLNEWRRNRACNYSGYSADVDGPMINLLLLLLKSYKFGKFDIYFLIKH